VFKLFLPTENEHPKYAIARCIDILMEARLNQTGTKRLLREGIKTAIVLWDI
jgi:hypothetical protein